MSEKEAQRILIEYITGERKDSDTVKAAQARLRAALQEVNDE